MTKVNLFGAFICLALIILVGNYTGQTVSAFSETAKRSTSTFSSIVVSEKTVDGGNLLAAKKITTTSGKVVGNEFSVCTTVAKGGLYGNGVQQCNGTFNLPKGKIIVLGTRHTALKYTFVIVGGSGFYDEATGTLEAFQTGASPRREALVFHFNP